MDDIERPGPKRVSTAIPNTSQLVDSRETNGEKCAAASRGLEFLSGQHRVEIECQEQQQTLTGVRGQSKNASKSFDPKT